jgi:hypothetical protein
MKIGVSLRGVSIGSNIGTSGHSKNWNISKENIKTNFIDCWTPNHEVMTYGATYDHGEIENIMTFYNLRKMKVLIFEGSNQRITVAESLKLMLDQDLDFIISSRFDLISNLPINTWPIDFDKFNFTFREFEPYWTDNKFADDCFFAFPKKYLEMFIDAILCEHAVSTRNFTSDLHNIRNHVVYRIGEQNTKFLFEGNLVPGYNEYMSISNA